jgi:GT2 family glycosyltransferase
MKLFLSLVSWNSEPELKVLLPKLVKVSEGIAKVFVFDNASIDNSVSIAKNLGVEVFASTKNVGFAGGQNEGVRRFLANTEFEIFCTVNPDIEVDRETLEKLINTKYEVITPKILRLDNQFNKTNIIDAAGMELHSSLRHFDRGSNEVDRGQYDQECDVFGGTGAFLALRRNAVERLLLRVEEREQLFDEAFFAYREDADLCWRMRRRGIKVRYTPSLIVYHQRKVLPENRRSTSAEINRMSVRNRFLLQVNNWCFKDGGFVSGIVVRNILVILGVLFFERSSFMGLVEFFKLLPRALRIREENFYG